MKNNNKVRIFYNTLTGIGKFMMEGSLSTHITWAITFVICVLIFRSPEILHTIAPGGFIH